MKRIIHTFLRTFGLKLQHISDERKEAENVNRYEWLKKYKITKVVDVGSNDGHFANETSRVFNDASYFCFEPIPPVFNKLKERFKERSLFVFHNVALGEADTTGAINLNDYSPSSSILEMESLHKEAFEFTRNTIKQEIIIKRLDQFNASIKPDSFTFLKIDVQGYEMHVIKGGTDFIRKCKVIVIEMSFERLYKDQPLFHDLYLELNRLGFEYHGNIDQLYNPVSHEILQADCLFVNRNV